MKPDTAKLLREKNVPGLLSAMRCGGDRNVRLKAVQAAGQMGDAGLVEALNRSLREDPDTDVQAEAFQSLKEILGNRAEDVVQTYNRGPAYEDEWIQVGPDPAGEAGAGAPGCGRPDLLRILEEGDAAALEEAMRFGPDREVRRLAARAAGRWEDLDLVEALVRSMKEDPEDSVRLEAREALIGLVGNRVDQVAASYGGGYPDAWIIENPWQEYEENQPEGGWDESSISVLFMMADDPQDVAKGVRAVKALAQVGTTRAVEALISLAMHGEPPQIRQTAREALEGFFGADLEEVLASYREEEEYPEEDPADAEADAAWQFEDEAAARFEDWPTIRQPAGARAHRTPAGPPSTLKEEGIGAIHLLLVAAATLVVIALVAMALGK